MSCMLTTLDNPYNPFKDFDLWNDYDQRLGHNTVALLDRLSPDVSEERLLKENERLLEETMNFIVENDPTAQYYKVFNK